MLSLIPGLLCEAVRSLSLPSPSGLSFLSPSRPPSTPDPLLISLYPHRCSFAVLKKKPHAYSGFDELIVSIQSATPPTRCARVIVSIKRFTCWTSYRLLSWVLLVLLLGIFAPLPTRLSAMAFPLRASNIMTAKSLPLCPPSMPLLLRVVCWRNNWRSPLDEIVV